MTGTKGKFKKSRVVRELRASQQGNPSFTRWAFLNLFLPFLPFALRAFVQLMGHDAKFDLAKFIELPELLFFSIYLCIVIVNISPGIHRTRFEAGVRGVGFFFLTCDFIVLTMIYSNSIGANVYPFSVCSTLVPLLIAPVYKLRYDRSREDIE